MSARKLSPEEVARLAVRAERERRNREVMVKLNAERVAAGVCRHCGGPLPCSSVFGDSRPGVRNKAPRKEINL